jgi:hypothetical protein
MPTLQRMARTVQYASPIVCASASLHADQIWLQTCEELPNLTPPQLAPKYSPVTGDN